MLHPEHTLLPSIIMELANQGSIWCSYLVQELKIDFTCYDHPVVLTVEEQVSGPTHQGVYTLFCNGLH